MKYIIDGDHICITRDDFIDLQQSPAIFYPLDSDIAKSIIKMPSPVNFRQWASIGYLPDLALDVLPVKETEEQIHDRTTLVEGITRHMIC